MEWSTNEKVALDTAFAASITGKRAACCMKQVGLNVTADSLMSAAGVPTGISPAVNNGLLVGKDRDRNLPEGKLHR